MDKYQLKYKQLKKYVKESVFINAAYCDEIVYTEEKIRQIQAQIEFLLKKLLEKQVVADLILKQQSIQRNTPTGNSVHTTENGVRNFGISQPRKSHTKVKTSNNSIKQCKQEVPISNRKRKANTLETSLPVNALTRCEPSPRSNKSIRRMSKSSRLLCNTERPTFPIHLSSLTVLSLGEIPDKAGFCTSDYVYPAGFCTLREFASIRDPSMKCSYLCRILDSMSGPQFEIVCNESPDHIFTSSSPSACYMELLQMVNTSRNGLEQLPIATKGEDFFGLTHPDVQQLLIKLGSYAQPNLSGKKSAVDNDPTICWEAYKFRYLNCNIKREF